MENKLQSHKDGAEIDTFLNVLNKAFIFLSFVEFKFVSSTRRGGDAQSEG